MIEKFLTRNLDKERKPIENDAIMHSNILNLPENELIEMNFKPVFYKNMLIKEKMLDKNNENQIKSQNSYKSIHCDRVAAKLNKPPKHVLKEEYPNQIRNDINNYVNDSYSKNENKSQLDRILDRDINDIVFSQNEKGCKRNPSQTNFSNKGNSSRKGSSSNQSKKSNFSGNTYLDQRHFQTKEKINKMRLEKMQKEAAELRNVPMISENSRRIAEKLLNNQKKAQEIPSIATSEKKNNNENSNNIQLKNGIKQEEKINTLQATIDNLNKIKNSMKAEKNKGLSFHQGNSKMNIKETKCPNLNKQTLNSGRSQERVNSKDKTFRRTKIKDNFANNTNDTKKVSKERNNSYKKNESLVKSNSIKSRTSSKNSKRENSLKNEKKSTPLSKRPPPQDKFDKVEDLYKIRKNLHEFISNTSVKKVDSHYDAFGNIKKKYSIDGDQINYRTDNNNEILENDRKNKYINFENTYKIEETQNQQNYFHNNSLETNSFHTQNQSFKDFQNYDQKNQLLSTNELASILHSKGTIPEQEKIRIIEEELEKITKINHLDYNLASLQKESVNFSNFIVSGHNSLDNRDYEKLKKVNEINSSTSFSKFQESFPHNQNEEISLKNYSMTENQIDTHQSEFSKYEQKLLYTNDKLKNNNNSITEIKRNLNELNLQSRANTGYKFIDVCNYSNQKERYINSNQPQY